MLGFLVGEQKEFSKLFTKLRFEWRTAKGDLSFSALKAGWFEISFSNHVDLNRIWEACPYHVFSQLLLLKQWHSGFDPSKESISQLDLWVRLHFLPEEFANSDTLTTILEGNFVGSFLKMDPSRNSNRMNMFTHFCINTNVALNKKIIIPDDNCNPIKYKLWFDDFPDGCGACGLPDHVFEESTNRAIPIPILKITIRKQSSTKPTGRASTNNKILPQHNVYLKHQNKPYLAHNSGVNFVYESEESDEMPILDPELDLELDSQPHLIFASVVDVDDEFPLALENFLVHMSPKKSDYGDMEPMNVDTLEQDEPSNLHEQGDNEYYEEEVEEPYEDDDTLLNLEIEQDSQLNTPSNPTGIEGLLSPAMETYETHPTDQEIDNFINYSPIADQENTNVSEASSTRSIIL
ncbi:LOW QUALITY PROTEIN: hypothetical protein V2J09_018377 [Rumex salicifolius]